MFFLLFISYVYSRGEGVWIEENINEILKMHECFNPNHTQIINNLFIYLYDLNEYKVLESKTLSYLHNHLITNNNFCISLDQSIKMTINRLRGYIKKNEKLSNYNEEMGYKKTLEHMIQSSKYTINECNQYNPEILQNNTIKHHNKKFHHHLRKNNLYSSIIVCMQSHRKNGIKELVKYKFKD